MTITANKNTAKVLDDYINGCLTYTHEQLTLFENALSSLQLTEDKRNLNITAQRLLKSIKLHLEYN
jgi:hypothetical protein